MGELTGRSVLGNGRKRVRSNLFSSRYIWFLSVCFIFSCIFSAGTFSVYGQTQTSQLMGNQQPRNYLSNSSAFRQEIARMEITVSRAGESPMPITQIPRVQKDDVIKVKMLDEAVGGIKPDQSYWDWTFLVAYVNPNRNNDKQKSVSEEIQFKKSGWYKEYSFVVPYDSQPVFFLYPKAKYRGKILELVNKKYEEVRKLGEKTVEIAGAYAQISSFLNELQFVLQQTQYSRYGSFITYPESTIPRPTPTPYNPYNPYNPIGNPNNNQNKTPDPIYNYNALMEQTIERLARSFNINLPQCWQTTNGGINYGSSYGGNSSYGGYGGTGSYGSSGGGSYGSGGYGSTTQNNFGYEISPDLIGRAQCVAKNVRLEDFDLSVANLLKQGGIFAATQLRDKYPQLAYWINIAAAALDFIVKVFQKSPLKIVPTIIQSSDDQQAAGGYRNNYASPSYPSGGSNSPSAAAAAQANAVKISLYAESQPTEEGFVTAYPIVVHKWQREPDPEVISLHPPILAEPCLHAGINLLKNSDLAGDFSADTFTRDFKLIMSSSNGFRKEFPLKKNLGLGGWELNLTNEDLNSIPKVKMTLEAEMTGIRGFNELKSQKFDLPISTGNSWQITPESQKNFTVGGKRRITIQNTLGSCRCLQAVIYKPSFGGQFVFTANSKENALEFSVDGREASFELDASHFQPGQGTLEIKTYGGDGGNQQPGSQQSNILNVKLYPLPPNISDLKISKGDSLAIITGERLEQLQFLKINGKKANMIGNNVNQMIGGAVNTQPNNSYPNQNQYPVQNIVQAPNQVSNQTQSPNTGVNQNTNPDLNLNLNLSPNQRAVVFENRMDKQTAATISVELGLEDNRIFTYPKTFNAGPARPTIAANELNEIEGVFTKNTTSRTNSLPNQSMSSGASAFNAQLAVLNSLIVPIDASEMSIAVRNELTDYDFKGENLSVETRIEKSQPGAAQSPQVTFEVLDSNTLRLKFAFNAESQKFIGGRRLQFRIRDRERGDSDWYTIKQTFVRLPNIISVKCTNEMNGQCELKGEGIDYVGQVSVDGGKSWYPQDNSMLRVQPTSDGQTSAMIPMLVNKDMLQIKLRDFSKAEGVFVNNYTFSNSAKERLIKRRRHQ